MTGYTIKLAPLNTLAVLSLVTAGACATTAPPKELVDARAEYTRTESGAAHTLNPAGVHEAKVALDKAEASYANDPGAEETADLAYLAQRRAQRAQFEAQTADWQRRRVQAMNRANEAQAKATEQVKSELVKTRQELETERGARVRAEERTRDVLSQLVAANAAAVKEEPRGTVISLSGNVLFASGKAQLLPGAQNNLGQIAEAIAAQSDKTVLVEGHTDSRGTESANLVLSKARAEAVGSYLVSRGIPADRVTTAGIGPNRPVADNNTAEGRANNRRVEIIIQTREAH
jgi:outer membrane protein OmpA-like peptidoglycan-associated protein